MREPTTSRTLLRAIVMLAGAILVLTGLVAYGYLRLSDQSASQAQIQHVEAAQQRVQTAQQLALVEGCERLNILRVGDNRSQYADWTIDRFFVAAIKHPTQRQTRRQRREARAFLGPVKRAVRAKTWTPLTDCTLAVNEHGARYKPPKPIRFSTRRPPRSALGG